MFSFSLQVFFLGKLRAWTLLFSHNIGLEIHLQVSPTESEHVMIYAMHNKMYKMLNNFMFNVILHFQKTLQKTKRYFYKTI